MQLLAKSLSEHLLNAHPRVAQFLEGVEDGTTKAIHTMQCVLPQYTDDGPGPEVDVKNPMVCLSLDGKNAFNAIQQLCCFDAMWGYAARSYYKGSLCTGRG